MRSVLIVDDDPAMIVILKVILEENEFEVIGTASNGQEAINIFKSYSSKPDFIFMDYRMPIKHGIDATVEILKVDKTARIIIISGDIEVRERAFRSGAQGFIKKPFTIENILNKIEKLDIIQKNQKVMA